MSKNNAARGARKAEREFYRQHWKARKLSKRREAREPKSDARAGGASRGRSGRRTNGTASQL